jgi:hypothetical protein
MKYPVAIPIQYLLVIMLVSVFMIVAMWRVFTKADQPGWGALIPIYNMVLMLRIAGKPGWWVIFCLIPPFWPVISIVVHIVITIDIARNFGRGGWFAAGLILLPIIFFPILAFGNSEYLGSGE